MTKKNIQYMSRRNQTGLTLVELLVSMTISMFMLIALALIYSTSKAGFAYANNTTKMSEDASFALDLLGRDVRMAGYAGCTGTRFKTDLATLKTTYTPITTLIDNQTITTASKKPNPFAGVVSGHPMEAFTANNAIWGFPANTTTAIGVLGGGSTTYTPDTKNPILYLAGGSSQALQVNAAVANITDSIGISDDPYKWKNNPNPTVMVIADCAGSELFRASSVDGAGKNMTIAHAITSNASDSLANTYTQDAIVMPLTTSVYFLATHVGASRPSLYRRYFDGSTVTTGSAEELIQNVEAITFQYGENTTNTLPGTPTYRADIYRTDAAAVTDWSRVVSVRVGLIMAGDDENQSTAAGQAVSWIGGTFTPAATDRRVRRAYSTTISIRNRMGL